MSSIQTCTACNYTRQPTDDVPEWECPKCQKVYNKITRAVQQQESVVMTHSSKDYIQVSITGENKLDSGSHIHFDGSRPVDPIAMKTKWTPAITNPLNELPREIIQSSATRVELSSTRSARARALPFLVIGIGVAIGVIHSTKYIPVGEKIFAVGSFFIIIGIGCIFPFLRNKPAVFDKLLGYFWKGGRPYADTPDMNSVQDLTLLEDIHALQLIYYKFFSGVNHPRMLRLIELNLVLKNNRRVNVAVFRAASVSFTPYFAEKKPRELAEVLGEFLGKPVWDAIDSMKSSLAPKW